MRLPRLGQSGQRLRPFGQKTASPSSLGLYCFKTRVGRRAKGFTPHSETMIPLKTDEMIKNNSADMSVRGASTETTRFYMGSLMSFLVKSSQTESGLCLLEYRSQPGHEPPPHIHIDQDEAFYMLEGELEVYCMGRVVTARAGEAVFLPRNQAHAWYVMSPTIRILIMTSPGGMDEYFEAMSSPATCMELPPAATTYALADPAHAIATGEKYGIKILTAAETAELLPHYPGFGATISPE